MRVLPPPPQPRLSPFSAVNSHFKAAAPCLRRRSGLGTELGVGPGRTDVGLSFSL